MSIKGLEEDSVNKEMRDQQDQKIKSNSKSLFSLNDLNRVGTSSMPMDRNLYQDSDHIADMSLVPSDTGIENQEPFASQLQLLMKQSIMATPRRSPREFSLDLTKLIFEGNHQEVAKLVQHLPDENSLDQKDIRGYPPLVLASKLAGRDPDAYYNIILCLLEAGADPRVKDCDGWTAFEEAVSRQQIKICSILYDYISAYKLRTLTDQQDYLEAALTALPDYVIHIKWEFDSSIIPLVSSIAPSDTFKITKRGSSLRLDSTIAGYKNLMTKRRPMCVVPNNAALIFNPTYSEQHTFKDYLGVNALRVYQLNHSKKTFFNPLEEVDLEEKKAILNDILNSSPIQGNFELIGSSLEQSKSIFGNPQTKEIAGFDCLK